MGGRNERSPLGILRRLPLQGAGHEAAVTTGASEGVAHWIEMTMCTTSSVFQQKAKNGPVGRMTACGRERRR